uniref:F-actin monooxygenase n=1 Tax=Octopus bimaculoides TaxID=37653 RepID=A0A0L8HHT4_OCTBM|eukprot:XP_014772483.1 PREDICTED: protein-methionine sulfoxide oxidase MICAL3-like isoform X3 [Octopus bimaculoides]
METSAPESGYSGDPNVLFDQFVNAGTCKSILHTFQLLCDALDIKQTDHRHFYRRLKLRLTSWKAQSLWAKLDKRASHKEYRKGEACTNTKVLIIGSGPCGLRTAIEIALLGGKAVVLEKRDSFSRNNVLHLWPFLITDLKNFGAKKFFGKFCAGSIDHISIRQLQCILLKVALIFGVEVHYNVSFENLLEPPADQSKEKIGWRALVNPANHPVSEYQFDVLIGADGKRNTLEGFQRKEFRGKLAIAVTANFINRNTQAEARVEEISGVAFIYNQKFFHQLKEKTGIDLENIVYYKDATHYFVMTAKKQSLLDKGVLKHDYSDTGSLLSRSNVDQEALLSYAREAADFSTNHQLPHMDYAVNHYGQADVAMFDFTSLFQAENACRILSKHNHKMIMALVGDSLLEPFWPTGSGCARGFLSALDSAWMIRSWAGGKLTPLQVIAERESIYRLLSQTKPENINKNYNAYTIDPNTRYPNLNSNYFRSEQVRPLYICDEEDEYLKNEINELPLKKPRNDDFIDSYTLLRWCQRVLNTGRHQSVNIIDFTSSWKSGLALCALIHTFRPDLIDFNSLNKSEVVKNNQLAFDLAEKEFGISPVMTGQEMAECDVPDKLAMVSYLSQFYVIFKKEKHPKLENIALTPEEGPKPYRSPSHRLSLLQKISNRFSKHKRLSRSREDEHLTFGTGHATGELKENRAPVELKSYSKLPINEISNRLTSNWRFEDMKKDRREVQSKVNVSAMAEILASKFKADLQPPPPAIKRITSNPTLLAAQPASEFCYFCKRRVYIMERMSAEGLFFHRGCLRCEHCKNNLRLSNYSCDRTITGEVRFYCFRHVGMMRQRRKRSLTEEPTKDEQDLTPGTSPPRIPPLAETYKNTPSTSPSIKKKGAPKVKDDSQLNLKNTPERVEFENYIEGVSEETEEEQFEHNLRPSLSSQELLEASDEEENSSDSDEELSDLELSDFLSQWTSEDDADVEDLDDDASHILTWEEACLLAETLQERQARESIPSKLADKCRLQLEDTDSTEESSDDETETEKGFSSDDADDTMKDQTTPDTENKTLLDEMADARTDQRLSRLRPTSKIEPLSPLRSPTSPASQMEARAKFFASPPEPVRLDAKLLFGIDKSEKAGEKTPTSSENVNNAKDEAVTPSTTDVTIGQVPDTVDTKVEDSNLDKDALKDAIAKSDITVEEDYFEGSEESETETLEEVASEEADTNDEIDDIIEENVVDDREAVGQAMEEVLTSLERRSTSSEEDEEMTPAKAWEGMQDDDDVFMKESTNIRDSAYNGEAMENGTYEDNENEDIYKGRAVEGDVIKGVAIVRNTVEDDNIGENIEDDNIVNDTEQILEADVKTDVLDEMKEEELQLNNSSEDESKSTETTNTEKAVLRSVSAMSDDTIVDSEDSTLQSVLRSLERMDEPSTPVLESEPWNKLDERFITKRKKKPKKDDGGSESDTSFTLSTPSKSIHSSLSSLNDALQYNKQILLETAANNSDNELLNEFQQVIEERLDEVNNEAENIAIEANSEEAPQENDVTLTEDTFSELPEESVKAEEELQKIKVIDVSVVSKDEDKVTEPLHEEMEVEEAPKNLEMELEEISELPEKIVEQEEEDVIVTKNVNANLEMVENESEQILADLNNENLPLSSTRKEDITELLDNKVPEKTPNEIISDLDKKTVITPSNKLLNKIEMYESKESELQPCSPREEKMVHSVSVTEKIKQSTPQSTFSPKKNKLADKKPVLVDIADRHPLFANKKLTVNTPSKVDVESSAAAIPTTTTITSTPTTTTTTTADDNVDAANTPTTPTEVKYRNSIPIKPPRSARPLTTEFDSRRPLSDLILESQPIAARSSDRIQSNKTSANKQVTRASSLPRESHMEKYLSSVDVEMRKKPEYLWKGDRDNWKRYSDLPENNGNYDMTVVSKQLPDNITRKNYSHSKSLDRNFVAGSRELSPAPKATLDESPTDLTPVPKPRRILPEVTELKRSLPPLKPLAPTPASRTSLKAKSAGSTPVSTATKEPEENKKQPFIPTKLEEKMKPNASLTVPPEGRNDKRRKIPVDASLKKPQKENHLDKQSSVVESIDDIPFADESDSDALTTISISSVEQFPGTLIKSKPVRRVSHSAFKKRILPAAPKKEPATPIVPTDSTKPPEPKKKERVISLTKMIPTNKRDSYNQDIPASVLLSTPYTTSPFWKMSPTPNTPIPSTYSDQTPVKQQSLTTNQSAFSPKVPSPTPKPFLSWSQSTSTKKPEKPKEGTQSEGSSTASTPKKEKKRSLLSMFLPSKSRNKSTSSGSESSDKQKTPTSSKEKKLGQKPSKTVNDKKDKGMKHTDSKDLDFDLSRDMTDLSIKSVFHVKDRPHITAEQKLRILESGLKAIIPPRGDDEFSDSGESFLSTDTSVSRRSKLSDPKKIQQAARKQQKRQQQQRLRRAQEIQRRLEEVDVQQKELEDRGVIVEKALRGEGLEAGRNEGELMQEWFNLVHEKNVLLRYESELMVQAKELELEDRQARLETELRNKMTTDDVSPTCGHRNVPNVSQNTEEGTDTKTRSRESHSLEVLQETRPSFLVLRFWKCVRLSIFFPLLIKGNTLKCCCPRLSGINFVTSRHITSHSITAKFPSDLTLPP